MAEGKLHYEGKQYARFVVMHRKLYIVLLSFQIEITWKFQVGTPERLANLFRNKIFVQKEFRVCGDSQAHPLSAVDAKVALLEPACGTPSAFRCTSKGLQTIRC